MLYIISILVIIIAISILRDTHVEKYYRGYSGPAGLTEEYDLKLPLWLYILIVLLGLIPLINIVLLIIFMTMYVYTANQDPNKRVGITEVVSLRGSNIITKIIIRITTLLCKKI